jgi:hypothetical protein
MEGFTENYIRVRFPARPNDGNRVMPVHVNSYDLDSGVCLGTIEAM